MSYTFRILFFLRKSSSHKEELSSIYVRITINGKASEFNSRIKIDPLLWDQKGQKARGRTKEIQNINKTLIKIHTRLHKLYDESIDQGEGIPSVEKLKEAFFTGKSREHKYLLLTIFDNLIAQKKELADNQVIKQSSADVFLCTKEKLISYMNIYYPDKELDIRKMDYEFINGFEIYLKSRAKCGHNTMIRHMRHLKQISTYAYKNGYLTKDPFYTITLSTKKTERSFLTEEEIKKVIELDLADEVLNNVRNVFIFQCFTGLSYVDVKQLKYGNIRDGIIITYREKTGNRSIIPLLEMSRMIIDIYSTAEKDHGDLIFPVYTSQRMNSYLKTIGDLSAINKTLTTHVGRHSFATLMISKGIAPEILSKMLGHTELKTTMIYAKILESKIIEDVKKADKQLTELTDAMKKKLDKDRT